MQGQDNPVFTCTSDDFFGKTFENQDVKKEIDGEKSRAKWDKDIEFLFSCIALSIGLGNIWRFPYVALQNGGGAFVIPYLIVLVLIGRPSYFIEMVMGQFSSRSGVRSYDCVPALRGIGMGQVIATGTIATFYSSIMAITLRYLFDSFRSILPWSYCRPEWGPCFPSGITENGNLTWRNDTKSSAELYFLVDVIRAKSNLLDGIGMPVWNLIGFLVMSWTIVFFIVFRGIKSSGKASYALALFPYVVLIILLVKAMTLPGSLNGIAYFFKPQWDKMWQPSVWYEAVAQVFFSLNVFLGSIVMYSSFNKFDHNVYRDANIVTTLDTFTSLLAGTTIFGIIGHLAHQLEVDDVSQVVKHGPGLAFISYPAAISQFTSIPQLYSVLFFFMLYLLGLGSNIAMVSCVTTVIRDQFKQVKNWHAALGFCVFGIVAGSLFLTEGGQSVLVLVDFYGVTFIAFILALLQLYSFCYIYGVARICKDINFMLGFYPGWIWIICWRFLTPGLMTIIVIYNFVFFKLPTDGAYPFPQKAHIVGWCIFSIGMLQIPIFASYQIYKENGPLWNRIKSSFKPTTHWGPRNPTIFQKYKESN